MSTNPQQQQGPDNSGGAEPSWRELAFSTRQQRGEEKPDTAPAKPETKPDTDVPTEPNRVPDREPVIEPSHLPCPRPGTSCPMSLIPGLPAIPDKRLP